MKACKLIEIMSKIKAGKTVHLNNLDNQIKKHHIGILRHNYDLNPVNGFTIDIKWDYELNHKIYGAVSITLKRIK